MPTRRANAASSPTRDASPKASTCPTSTEPFSSPPTLRRRRRPSRRPRDAESRRQEVRLHRHPHRRRPRRRLQESDPRQRLQPHLASATGTATRPTTSTATAKCSAASTRSATFPSTTPTSATTSCATSCAATRGDSSSPTTTANRSASGTPTARSSRSNGSTRLGKAKPASAKTASRTEPTTTSKPPTNSSSPKSRAVTTAPAEAARRTPAADHTPGIPQRDLCITSVIPAQAGIQSARQRHDGVPRAPSPSHPAATSFPRKREPTGANRRHPPLAPSRPAPYDEAAFARARQRNCPHSTSWFCPATASGPRLRRPRNARSMRSRRAGGVISCAPVGVGAHGAGRMVALAGRWI